MHKPSRLVSLMTFKVYISPFTLYTLFVLQPKQPRLAKKPANMMDVAPSSFEQELATLHGLGKSAQEGPIRQVLDTGSAEGAKDLDCI